MATKKDAIAPNAEVPMRRCIGSTRFGIEPHDAPITDFPAQPSQKDGLGRMCKPHWTGYTRALRQAALERNPMQAGPALGPEPTIEQESPSPKRGRRAKTEPEADLAEVAAA